MGRGRGGKPLQRLGEGEVKGCCVAAGDVRADAFGAPGIRSAPILINHDVLIEALEINHDVLIEALELLSDVSLDQRLIVQEYIPHD